MTREIYGATSGDIATQISSDGDFEPGTALFDVFTTRTGSTQHTNLLDISGAAITFVTPDAQGRLVFQGLDGYAGTYWLQQQGTSTLRYAVPPSQLAELVAAISAGGVTSWATHTGPVTPVLADLPFGVVGALLAAAVTEADGRDALGVGATGETLFTSATQTAARTTGLGFSALGEDLVTSPDAADARADLGAGSVGDQVFTSATPSAVRGFISAPSQAETDLKIRVTPGGTAFQFGKGPIASRPAPGTSGLLDGALWLETA